MQKLLNYVNNENGSDQIDQNQTLQEEIEMTNQEFEAIANAKRAEITASDIKWVEQSVLDAETKMVERIKAKPFNHSWSIHIEPKPGCTRKETFEIIKRHKQDMTDLKIWFEHLQYSTDRLFYQFEMPMEQKK
ncbi:hypothetical protein Acj9p128 [Acinetobacter phage Acj9]|uniref:Uncharacterized protein n=1 Tax=Acinetobacter phage Acj9 TaxID=760939 RepID=E5EPR2_9CAUD|nr:hypothetical protein Acj9p128 [Acinetobacter phage Acj9]ADG60028.1 hypothetical protein Acj9p128 [Acinetobacter phage Acj9]